MSNTGDAEAKLAQARQNKPLRQLITEFGCGPKTEHGWGSLPKCPVCEREKCSGVFARGGRDWFKCHHDDCPSGKKGMDEVALVAAVLALSRKEAFVQYLKMAGVWKEERLSPSVMPGQRARKAKAPELPEEHPAVQTVAPSAPEPDAALLAGDAGTETEVPPWEGESNAGEAPEAAGEKMPPDLTVEPAESLSADGLEGLQAARQAEAPAAREADEAREEGGKPRAVAVPPPLRALRQFYAQLSLSEKDQQAVRQKRGLEPWMAKLAGLVSNPRENLVWLRRLSLDDGLDEDGSGAGVKDDWQAPPGWERFEPQVLVSAGLWTQESGAGRPKPNARYYGFHTWEEKVEGKKETKTGWTNPILIPYWDRRGELVALRPHRAQLKGMPIRVYEAENCLRRACAGECLRAGGLRFEGGRFVAAGASTGEASSEAVPAQAGTLAVLTEGEFKAMAVAQAVWSGERKLVAAAAIPGISMAKPLYGDLLDWLDVAAMPLATVVVGFDSEDKTTPGLPGYNPDKSKCFDAEKWARYAAIRFSKEGYDGRVASLPVAWRENGKADWDGALAKLCRDLGGPEWRWEKVGAKVAQEFRRVFTRALRADEARQSEMFGSEAERIISSGLERLLRETLLPVGGEAEMAQAARIRRFVGRAKERSYVPDLARGHLLGLASAYTELGGGYYTLKAPSEKMQERIARWVAAARDAGDAEFLRMLRLLEKGVPKRISDFYMVPHFKVIRANRKSSRLVSLFSIHGEVCANVELHPEQFSQPVKFRQWLLECGGFSFGMGNRAGEIQTQQLNADVAAELADKTVAEVVQRGYHEDSGLWFFRDAVYPHAGGEPFRPDNQRIIWVKGAGRKLAVEGWTQGYLLSEPAKETERSKQAEPAMHPARGSTVAEDAALFGDVAVRLEEAQGSMDAFIGIGMILANLASVEIRKAHSCFPGLWVHGEQGHGKSSTVRWLMSLLGFSLRNGIKLATSSVPGLMMPMMAMGNLPFWMEEYQHDTPKWIIDFLKSTYGGEPGAKMTEQRELRATAVVSGVAMCRDAQTKSRFAHMQVANQLRRVDHFTWFQENCVHFYRIGRRVMMHRARYAELVMTVLDAWIRSDEMRQVEARSRMVHGVAYAGFVAAVTLFNELLAAGEETESFGKVMTMLVDYRRFLAGHCRATEAEVREAVNANQFIQDVLSALKAGVFGLTPGEVARYFRWEETPRTENGVPLKDGGKALGPPGAEGQAERPNRWGTGTPLPWGMARLYFPAGAVLDKLAAWKRSQGKEPALDQADLRAQLAVKNYWVDGAHAKRFGLDTGRHTPKERCWCWDVTEHELGYQPVSDEEFQASFYAGGDPGSGIFIEESEWDDPRKGDLWLIEAALRTSSNRE